MGLVEGYPRDVTFSRRRPWWPATGWEGRWVLPDWEAVASEYDGVHLGVAGFIDTATRVLPAMLGARTALAMWEPDATFWLNDTASISGGVNRWDGQWEWVNDQANLQYGDDGSVWVRADPWA